MLDQNTDRLWYVIGAVILGAAIILLLNGTVPNLFAQVAGTMKGPTDEFSTYMDAKDRNLIDSSDMTEDSYVNVPIGSGYEEDVPLGDLVTDYYRHDTTGYIPTDSEKEYIFFSEHDNGVWFMRTGYYDEEGNVVGTRLRAGDDYDNKQNPNRGYADDEITLEIPKGASYVRISADSQDHRTGPVGQWRLIEVPEESEVK